MIIQILVIIDNRTYFEITEFPPDDNEDLYAKFTDITAVGRKTLIDNVFICLGKHSGNYKHVSLTN